MRNRTPKLPLHRGLRTAGCTLEIPKGKTATFYIAPQTPDTLTLTLVFLPNHPINEQEGLCVTVSCNGQMPQKIDYATKGRSEEWKENVLANRATRTLAFPIASNKSHKLAITALSDGVMLDCIEIKTNRKK